MKYNSDNLYIIEVYKNYKGNASDDTDGAVGFDYASTNEFRTESYLSRGVYLSGKHALRMMEFLDTSFVEWTSYDMVYYFDNPPCGAKL